MEASRMYPPVDAAVTNTLLNTYRSTGISDWDCTRRISAKFCSVG